MRLGRRLLRGASGQPEAQLQNTVFVTLQINAGSYDRTPAVIADLQAALSQQGPYNVVPLQASYRTPPKLHEKSIPQVGCHVSG